MKYEYKWIYNEEGDQLYLLKLLPGLQVVIARMKLTSLKVN